MFATKTQTSWLEISSSVRARPSPAVHDGAGVMQIQSLVENPDTDTNLWFLHRGTIPPKTGIGHHFHNQCVEVFEGVRDPMALPPLD